MRRLVAPAVLAILLAALVARLPAVIAQRSATLDALAPLVESRQIVRRRFVREVDDEAAVVAAVRGYLDALGDPYTEYIPPRDEAAFERTMRGDYAGIGAEVGTVDGAFTIFTPMAGSPALEAGVRAGDIVLAVDGETVEGADATAVVERLVGPVGTTVAIRVRHLDGTEEDLVVTRRRIVSATIRGLERVGEGWIDCLDAAHGIRYVHLTQFNTASADELRTALVARPGEPFRGLILDLRDNPGGGLETAVAVSDLFLDGGVVVRVVPRVGDPVVHSATAGTVVPADLPIVVLVNGNAASASEIVAGSLQAHGRAKVAGSRTYGKGSVQEVRPLGPVGTLKYTIAAYELLGGRRIQRAPGADRWGVDPDPGLARPVPAAAWSDVLVARRPVEAVTGPGRPDPSAPMDPADCRSIEWVDEALGDAALVAAAEALAVRIDSGDWPVPDPAAIAAVDRMVDEADLRDLRDEYARRIGEIDARIESLAAEPAEDARPDADSAGGDP